MADNYYQILGIARSAPQEEIKKAYRKLAMEFHPDRNPGRERWANEKFKEINEAFSVLGDPEKRQRYDQFGAAEYRNLGDVFRSSATRGGFQDVMRDFNSAGLGSDFLNELFGDFMVGRDFTFRRFNNQGSPRSWPRSGSVRLDDLFGGIPGARTVRYELRLTRTEAKRGTAKYLSRNGKTLEVTIPPGVRSGNVVKLSDALHVTDGRPGDILIQIKVR